MDLSPGAIRIVSGGQTGVDRGALDGALAVGAPCGGWCPAERRAEDGRIPERYPLKEMNAAGYSPRTLRNVQDSDGTVILHFSELEGGTRLTARLCRELEKPLLLIDADRTTAGEAAGRMQEFVVGHGITTLNVAGPRASKAPRARAWTEEAIRTLLIRLGYVADTGVG